MIPLSLVLLACAAVYLGAVEAAFSALMRLSLRLAAERTDRPGSLGTYLDDPILLVVPVRLLLGLVTAVATALLSRGVGVDGLPALGLVMVSAAAFVLVFLIVGYIIRKRMAREEEEALKGPVPIERPPNPATKPIPMSAGRKSRN